MAVDLFIEPRRWHRFDVRPPTIVELRQYRLVPGKRDVLIDLFEANLSDATVVTLYLSYDMNQRLRPKLMRELRPGARIVSHDFDMGDWLPSQTIRVAWRDRTSYVFLWVVPPRS